MEVREKERAIGYIYRLTCSCGKVYVGMSTQLSPRALEEYLGSGTLLRKHREKNPEHLLAKEILSYHETLEALLEAEVQEILKEKELSGRACLNLKTTSQASVCSECLSPGSHRRACSSFSQQPCPECGAKNPGAHRRRCSQRKETSCGECSLGSGQHRRGCSSFRERRPCEACGKTYGPHLKACPSHKKPKACEECLSVSHKRTCSRYKRRPCPECHGALNSHKKAYKAVLPMCSNLPKLHYSVIFTITESHIFLNVYALKLFIRH